jgi:predicted nucleic acid-binding protein
MDLLIATAAILDDAPLVTGNVKDFSRVPGLRVIGYG